MISKEELYERAARSVLEANESLALQVLEDARAEGFDLLNLLIEGFGAGNDQLGDHFDKGIISLPELIYAASVMKNITNRTLEILNEEDDDKEEIKPPVLGTVVLATVEGDVHDIGKGIVASTLRSAGFVVHDLGSEVPVEKILKYAEEYDADIIGTSALLTSTLREQKKLEKLLIETENKDRFITMVGGAPCTSRWARKIGADGYSENAVDAVKVARELIRIKKEREEQEE